MFTRLQALVGNMVISKPGQTAILLQDLPILPATNTLFFVLAGSL